MNEQNLTNYYNKFNENKRLLTRHGKLEFITVTKYIEIYLKKYKHPKIIDIGAGTGRYAKYLAEKGFDVTAVELVKHNLRIIEEDKRIKAYQGNALDLSRFKDKSFDIVLLFGPLYHLISDKDKLKALREAKRILKDNGIMFVQYIMNEYCVITHGFKEKMIINEMINNKLDNNYKITPSKQDLYAPVRICDINFFNEQVKLKRIKILSPTGPANYIRKYINKLTEQEFNIFIDYHLKTCEKYELLGASSHILDILIKK